MLGNKKIDLVCGMDLTEAADFVEVLYKERAFYFCSQDCRERFKREPEKFQREPLVKLQNIWKVFKQGQIETPVLRGLNLHIWEGDFVAIIGASGSGKTTALNMLGLLDRPSSGRIFLEGQDVSLLKDEEKAELRSKKFGFVFQQYNLMPWLTAYENITLPAVFAGKNINSERLEKQIQETGLQERMTHRPFELSGGEQQRVALLRALSNDPEIILGDEPTGNLDSATGNKILELLTNLNKPPHQDFGSGGKIQKKTLVIVTHDADIAGKADQIITLKDGQMVKNHQAQRKMYTE